MSCTKTRRNSKNEIEISFEKFVDDYLQNGRLHGLGYHHLTTWTTLCKMMKPVEVPGREEKHRMLHLGAAEHMNDKDESKCGKHVFFSSFSFGPSENISMWTNYGIPNPEAIRIKFSRDSISNWKRLFEQGKVQVYGVTENFDLECIKERPQLKFIDIGYWDETLQGGKVIDKNKGVMFYNKNKYRITNHRKDLKDQMDRLPYLFKKYGWSYEQETRLLLIFSEPLADQYKRIAIEFDEPIQDLEKNFKENVTYGPWYKEDNPLVQPLACGHSLKDAKESEYHSKMEMRSVCDSCKQEDKENCKCPFKGQR